MKKMPVALQAAPATGQAPAQKGRPPVIGEHELALIDRLYMEERMSVRDIADVMGVSHMTVWRAVSAPPPLAGQEN